MTGSFDHGVSWKSRLLRLQVKDAPSAEVWKPNDALEMTLIQGCGVERSPVEPHDIVAAVLGRSRQSRSRRRGPVPSARGGRAGRARRRRPTASARRLPPATPLLAVAGPAARPASARSIWSKIGPLRVCSTMRATASSVR